MKKCDVCGTLNLNEYNFCTHCGCDILIENICPFCGQKNPDSQNCCINCHEPIVPIVIDSFDILFSEHNLNLISSSEFSNQDYLNILDGIFTKLDYYKFTGKTPKELILQIASVFTTVIPKSSGIVRGEMGYAIIQYDDRLDDSLQISTIIHELAHFLLFDISVNMLAKILSVEVSSTLKGFTEYFLTRPEMELMNEYYAHTVENRFIPIGFQNFTSFETCVENLADRFEELDFLLVVGNTFAKDVIGYLEKSIDEKLRDLIKLQYKHDFIEKKEVNYWAIDAILEMQENNKIFISFMAGYFEELFYNEEARSELEYIKSKFEN